jgi:hypothetical protein
VTDIAKTELDFITYSQESLIWFALNTVGSVMPIVTISIVLFRLQADECYIGNDCGDGNKLHGKEYLFVGLLIL